MRSHPSSKRAFTLIELLVVIAIIAILMGLLFPAIAGAIKQAKKTAARNDVTQIAIAVNNFYGEYGRMPAGTPSTVSGDFLKSLTGNLPSDNPRNIVFLDAPTAKKGKSGTNSDGYVDPWAKVYQIAIDTAYSGSVQAMGQTINGNVAVWMQTNADVTTTNSVPTSW